MHRLHYPSFAVQLAAINNVQFKIDLQNKQNYTFIKYFFVTDRVQVCILGMTAIMFSVHSSQCLHHKRMHRYKD